MSYSGTIILIASAVFAAALILLMMTGFFGGLASNKSPKPKHKRKGSRPFLRASGESAGEPDDFEPEEGVAGDPRTCPLCAAKFDHGELVRSKAFPASGGGKGWRMLHMEGCKYCMSGKRLRICPVCGANVTPNEYLIARLYERPGKSHVHILGCLHCRI
jgi:hypothetical protein